jgi:hypothetical protein
LCTKDQLHLNNAQISLTRALGERVVIKAIDFV